MNVPTVRAKCLGDEVSADLPAVWQGRALDFQCGFFQDAETPEDDFANIAQFHFILSRDRIEGTAVVSVAVVGAEFMTTGGWNDGTQQHITFSLSGAQMNFDLINCQESLWWTVCATLHTGEVVTKGAGFLPVREDAATSAIAAGEIINSVTADFVIIDDVVYLTSGTAIYTLPAVFVGPGSADGIITVSNNVFYFHSGGRWSHPATPGAPPSGAVEGEAVVIDDVLYVTLNGVAYSAAVVPTDEIPPMPVAPGTTLVVGSDGAQYEKTTYVDGTVRYKAVYEELP